MRAIATFALGMVVRTRTHVACRSEHHAYDPSSLSHFDSTLWRSEFSLFVEKAQGHNHLIIITIIVDRHNLPNT